MSVKSKWRGYFLVELLVALSILGLILPSAINVMKVTFKTLKSVLKERQYMIERLDIHGRIQEDANKSHELSENCCFKTQAHHICYDIKNKRLRRRKRRWDAQRFYTHYIGQKPIFDELICTTSPLRAEFKFKRNNDDPLVWQFFLGNE